MRYSGLIYAVIVAAWAGVLVPRWVRRNEEVGQAREADTARGVRVLERSEPRRHIARGPLPHVERTILSGGNEGLGVGAESRALEGAGVTAEASADAGFEAEIGVAGTHAAQRRRQVLMMLLGVMVLAAAGAIIGAVGVLVPAAVGLANFGFLMMCRRAAVRENVLSRVQRSSDYVEQAPMADDVEAEPEVRVAVLDIPESAADDPDAWAPVAVPRPAYLEKPAVPREAARSIDLNSPGAWTSGRLDIDETQSVPAASRADDRDDFAEDRRAVGD